MKAGPVAQVRTLGGGAGGNPAHPGRKSDKDIAAD
jgi:hypothetical protein